MTIEFGNWNFNISEVEMGEMTFSKLTCEQLHMFRAKLEIVTEDVTDFEKIFEEHKNGNVLVTDEELGLNKKTFSAKIERSSTSSTLPYKSYRVCFTETCSKKITGIEFENMIFETDEITQEMSRNAIVINLKVVVTPKQFKLINQLAFHIGKTSFPVIRLGINNEPIQMRFGHNVWSEENGVTKMHLVLVENTYDTNQDSFHGINEPDLKNAKRMILNLRATNSRLLDILESNNLITDEQRISIEKELSPDELNKEGYLFDRVNNVDEW